jgi:bacillithiol system protein YtxJ
MHPNLTTVQDIAHLERLLAESQRHPVLFFKHSLTCGVSAEALDELVAHLGTDSGGARYALIRVQTHRDVSTAAAARLGVRHQSPQAILVHDGRVVWTASHFRVNADEIRKALDAVGPSARAPSSSEPSLPGAARG